ncbi:MAG: MerR family transcriptional regulator, partial [Lachnospiraceae bacterium]|nr:MerR family transcriptional regulator [Lachnospiraceae bacterium]
MTIKEFSKLCECNPQTLRYYDGIGLLKPVNVDPWTGYRYYDEAQAETYVKIKNLQKAGFTIDEIRSLLEQDDRAVYDAFEVKVKEAEERLREIKLIRQSYQS